MANIKPLSISTQHQNSRNDVSATVELRYTFSACQGLFILAQEGSVVCPPGATAALCAFGLGSHRGIMASRLVIPISRCRPTPLPYRPRWPCVSTPPTCSPVSFRLLDMDACPRGSGGGESVAHTNAGGQRCARLFPPPPTPRPLHSDVGSCPLRFLSPELRDDLTQKHPPPPLPQQPPWTTWPRNPHPGKKKI